ncbi:MAG: alkaline phosphatase D family protein, partial [Chloroflexales bacterium]|nr:alkaline phosphatase D family protein [Chloroflexales bacterium]
SLEQLADPATQGVAVLPKALVANLEEINAPDKIEGMAQAGPNTLAVINDNDFNISPTDGTSAGPNVKSQLLTFSTLENSVAAGDVTTSTAVLWARASATGNVAFAYSTRADLSGAISATAPVTSTLVPAKLQATGLISGTTYYYRATDAAGVATSGRFRTPSASPNRAGLRFGVSGDWRGELSPYPSISNADERDLAFFVEHGDTIYADVESPILPGITQTTTLEQYRLKHSEVYGPRFGLNTWGDLRATTAVIATIDDHEVTNDFAGGAPASSDPRFAPAGNVLINDTPLYETGMRAFQESNPLRDEFYGDTGDARTANERKLYRYRAYGGDAAAFVIDARSFRDRELANVANPTDPAQVGAFLAASFDPSRTMLGRQQLDDLKADLLRSQRAGVVWKFVMIPEPIQNLGVVGAADRYEGYAAERTALLGFIKENGITNVVFVAADIHGTVVNNLTYQKGVGQPQIASGAFEITTGAVAYDAPFGPTVIDIAAQAGLVTPAQKALYDSLPRAGKDEFLRTLIDTQLTPLGYDKVGLAGSDINATLTIGGYVAAHVFGWTEFEIDRATQKLTVRTYGIDSYTQAQLNADPASIAGRVPAVVSEFVVTPQQNRVYLPVVAR